EGFMPGSLVDTKYIPDFKEFKDQELRFIILEYDREKGKLILSRRKVLEAENAKDKEATLGAIKVGSTITGTVKRLTDFGAFVDVGGIDGLVHISELSWERVNHPSEVLKVGEEVEVKVLEVIMEKERISLSIRKTQADPWSKAISDLETGQLITGKVTRLVNFGAFIEIKPGVEGLAHISQLADFHVKHPSEVLKEGEEVEVKIIELKPKAKRISLSLKDASGVLVATGTTSSGDSTDNGNVTLGDVFGDMFDRDDYASNEVEADETEKVDEVKDVEGGQG
ncbi:MAG: S1 RNA-binding domain-containing protein, partial [Dethiobacteria bacterium]|nr:S1 RNA-binding domain-containing protein [Dethiobacteria bacterium]